MVSQKTDDLIIRQILTSDGFGNLVAIMMMEALMNLFDFMGAKITADYNDFGISLIFLWLFNAFHPAIFVCDDFKLNQC
jgi:hypothetical protein